MSRLFVFEPSRGLAQNKGGQETFHCSMEVWRESKGWTNGCWVGNYRNGGELGRECSSRRGRCNSRDSASCLGEALFIGKWRSLNAEIFPWIRHQRKKRFWWIQNKSIASSLGIQIDTTAYYRHPAMLEWSPCIEQTPENDWYFVFKAGVPSSTVATMEEGSLNRKMDSEVQTVSDLKNQISR